MTIQLSDQFANDLRGGVLHDALASTLSGLCDAAMLIAGVCAQGPLADGLGAATGIANADGDEQKALDVRSDEFVIAALKKAPVAYYASEEEEGVLDLGKQAPLVVACDPLDGSSNIDTNVSIGTIFSIYETVPNDPKASFFRKGDEQLVGGFFVYGPQTTLVMTAGNGVELYVLSPESGKFELAIANLQIAEDKAEFGINASNVRFWHDPVRNFIKDCQEGVTGPLGKNYNMRWVGSLVADASRILSRGGLFMYPSDNRKGYEEGRLRLLYEAHPVSFVMEQAGGSATNGSTRILELSAENLHERVPLVFGSKQQVKLVKAYHDSWNKK